MQYRFFSDPGHGWLEVSKKEIDRLNIGKQVSAYSYTGGEFVYLEEDCDAGLFFLAKRAAGEPIDILEVHSNKDSFIRSLNRFRATLD